MSNTMEELYDLVNMGVSNNCDKKEKLHTLAMAQMALLEELEPQEYERTKALVDVYQSLEAERHSLHEKALFQAALELGMELGRLGA